MTVIVSPYDNDYQRVLFGIEGAPLKCAAGNAVTTISSMWVGALGSSSTISSSKRGGIFDDAVNKGIFQYFIVRQLGQGWYVNSAPIISVNWKAESGDRWTIPVGIGVSKTQVIGGRPWKFQLQYWNYVEAPDAFAASSSASSFNAAPAGAKV